MSYPEFQMMIAVASGFAIGLLLKSWRRLGGKTETKPSVTTDYDLPSTLTPRAVLLYTRQRLLDDVNHSNQQLESATKRVAKATEELAIAQAALAEMDDFLSKKFGPMPELSAMDSRWAA